MKYSNKILPPLYYAIILHFLDGKADSAQGVVDALMSDYKNYKLLNVEDVEEALATAKENGLLDEVSYRIGENSGLTIEYGITDFGIRTVYKYIDSSRKDYGKHEANRS